MRAEAAPTSLNAYRAKRDFKATPEPEGAAVEPGHRLIVQHHFATRDHYDLRLEIGGVLVSWAVTRGPSANPSDRRLAVRTEDHPLDYATFEGLIPKGQYGGGTVILWEYTRFTPNNGAAAQALRKGEIKFIAHGERMRGGWVLVRMHTKEKRENWLLIKERDAFAEDDDSLTSRFPSSVSTRRTRIEIERRQPVEAATVKTGPALPAFVAPQLCSVAPTPPEGDKWIYELKYDGYRLELAAAGGRARLYTRSGLDWSEKFAPIAGEAAALKCRSALIDGEAVVLDENGVSQFPALVAALEQQRPDAIVFVAFDLMSLDGVDLRQKPLRERQRTLRKVVGKGGAHIRLADHIVGDGQRVFEQAVAGGAEGIIAKDRNAPYVAARSRAWVKIKGYPRTDVVIVGYKPSARTKDFASLHAAIEEGGKLRYVGGVGTGYSRAQRAAIFARISRGASSRPPADLVGDWPRDLKFVKQPLRAEIRFGGWTGDRLLRQARFLALREDLPVNATPKPAAPAPPRALTITHAEKIVYPADDITKGEIAAYYDAVADRLAPHLADRPLSIVRAPESIEETFFQRHPLRGMEAGIIAVEVGSQTYMALDGAIGLHSAAQFGAIELHGWMSRIGALDAPDRMVFDLDPDESLPFDEVKRAATDIAKALKQIGLKSWPLLTGGKGVHVVAPLDGGAGYAETEPFAKGFAQALGAHQPQRFVATMSKQRRKGRIFVDWLRNKKSATAILPWSLRARPGAVVATPLTWDALAEVKSAAAYDIKTALKLKDPWRGFFTLKQSLPRDVKA
ncbi:MAG TPA: DNA ligase D [Roseiarcus sp.]|nr:DNA ligase D [Roseiarcus sp.]